MPSNFSIYWNHTLAWVLSCNHTLAWMLSCKFAVYFQAPFYKNTSGGLLLEENPADSISLEFCKFCKNMFYKEDHQTTATENKLEIESSSISRIWGKHKERLIKGDCLSMLLNSLYPIDKQDCQKINVLKGSWQRCNSKYFKSKEHYNKLRWQWNYKNYLEDLDYL